MTKTFIKCEQGNVALLQSLGALTGTYDPERGGVIAVLTTETLAKLADFPADFAVEEDGKLNQEHGVSANDLPFMTVVGGHVLIHEGVSGAALPNEWTGICCDAHDVHSLWFIGHEMTERTFDKLQARTVPDALIEVHDRKLQQEYHQNTGIHYFSQYEIQPVAEMDYGDGGGTYINACATHEEAQGYSGHDGFVAVRYSLYGRYAHDGKACWIGDYDTCEAAAQILSAILGRSIEPSPYYQWIETVLSAQAQLSSLVDGARQERQDRYIAYEIKPVVESDGTCESFSAAYLADAAYAQADKADRKLYWTIYGRLESDGTAEAIGDYNTPESAARMLGNILGRQINPSFDYQRIAASPETRIDQ